MVHRPKFSEGASIKSYDFSIVVARKRFQNAAAIFRVFTEC
jgi:hypothetical protein